MLVSVNTVKKEPDTIIHRKLQKNTETKKFVLFSFGKNINNRHIANRKSLKRFLAAKN